MQPCDVFISYSAADKSAADGVCAALEATGLRCWIAPRDLEPGTEWAEGIIDALDATRSMVLIFSEHANSSPHVRREIERAFKRSLAVIPYRVQNVQPTKALEYFLGNVHWLDAFDGPAEGHLAELARRMAKFLVARPAPIPPAAEPEIWRRPLPQPRVAGDLIPAAKKDLYEVDDSDLSGSPGADELPTESPAATQVNDAALQTGKSVPWPILAPPPLPAFRAPYNPLEALDAIQHTRAAHPETPKHRPPNFRMWLLIAAVLLGMIVVAIVIAVIGVNLKSAAGR